MQLDLILTIITKYLKKKECFYLIHEIKKVYLINNDGFEYLDGLLTVILYIKYIIKKKNGRRFIIYFLNNSKKLNKSRIDKSIDFCFQSFD